MSDAGDIGRERRRWAQIEPLLCGVWTELYLGSWGAGFHPIGLLPMKVSNNKSSNNKQPNGSSLPTVETEAPFSGVDLFFVIQCTSLAYVLMERKTFMLIISLPNRICGCASHRGTLFLSTEA